MYKVREKTPYSRISQGILVFGPFLYTRGSNGSVCDEGFGVTDYQTREHLLHYSTSFKVHETLYEILTPNTDDYYVKFFIK